MKALLIAAWLGAGMSAAIAQDRCAASDLAIKACVKQSLIDDNILINGCSPIRAASRPSPRPTCASSTAMPILQHSKQNGLNSAIRRNRQ
jgi:hypothetical protein